MTAAVVFQASAVFLSAPDGASFGRSPLGGTVAVYERSRDPPDARADLEQLLQVRAILRAVFHLNEAGASKIRSAAGLHAVAFVVTSFCLCDYMRIVKKGVLSLQAATEMLFPRRCGALGRHLKGTQGSKESRGATRCAWLVLV